jgi:hypothetical protein
VDEVLWWNFSGKKLAVCVEEIIIVGHHCTYEGQLLDDSKVVVIKKWGPCKNLSDVHAFLGTVSLLCIFIWNFAHHAHHLIKLMQKDIPFQFGPEQIAAQEDLKQAILKSPTI